MKIYRHGKGPKFSYKDSKGKAIKDKDALEYLNKLKTPPAYTDVIIYYPPNSNKLLYQGVDTKGRQQCIYAPAWKKKSKKEYFTNLAEFGKQLPKINTKINQLIRNKRFTKNKQIAVILRIVTLCNFRVGNQKYEALYNSHGIATIKKKHIRLDTTSKSIHIEFIGKKGVLNQCVIADAKLYKVMHELLKDKKDNHYVFTYNEDGEHHRIKAVHINNWLKKFHPSFSSKMFRTFTTNTLLLDRMKEHNPKSCAKSCRKKNIVQFMKEVSSLVHNTPCICRKDYADADLINLYIEHPRKWNAQFANVSSRVGFTNFLLSK